MLKEEFQYYLDNQNELLKQYKGKFVVIVGHSVVGAYRTFKDAVLRSAKKYALGTFLVQECTEGDEAYTDHFYNSNVIFA